MNKQKKYLNRQRGFSLVEVLVVVLIMSVAFMSFYVVSTVGTKYIIESKNRLAAVALLNEKMEIIRNLAYADVGLQGGVAPVGNILQDEDVTSNGRHFHVYTQIEYFDDSLDGLFENNADSIPNDYKIVRVVISWKDSNGTTQEVASVSRFVPPGLETSEGGAPLAINISDSSGTGIPQALVHIVNNSVSPVINTTIQTDSEGHIMFPSAPPSIGGYQLTITKNGYETITTMSPSLVFFPTYPHTSVIFGSLNTYGYIQDQLSNLTVKTIDYQNNPIGSIEFTIEGGKTVGRDDYNNEIFSMPSTVETTGSTSGGKKYVGISPGSYTITINENAQYKFVDFDPSQSPAMLVPGSDMTYALRVADKSVNGLILKISDSDNNSVAGAEVKMTDSSNNEIFSGKKSSLSGVVFFPDDATVLSSGDYNLEISAEGFQIETIGVTIDNLTEKTVQLTSN